MKVRFYVAPQQGDGTMLNPFRSVLNDLINISQGDWFDEIDHPARRISICCVHASDATHAVILADSRPVPISELYEEGAVGIGLAKIFNNITESTALKTKMENQGISTAWITSSNTMRDVLRYLIRIFTITQVSDGEGNTNVKEFLKANLTTTVAQIPVGIRTAIRNWMQAKGLAIGWITNATTVREIVHFIIENLGIGKLKMSGEEF